MFFPLGSSIFWLLGFIGWLSKVAIIGADAPVG